MAGEYRGAHRRSRARYRGVHVGIGDGGRVRGAHRRSRARYRDAHVGIGDGGRVRGAHVGTGDRGRGITAPTWAQANAVEVPRRPRGHRRSRSSTAGPTWAQGIVGEYRGAHVGTGDRGRARAQHWCRVRRPRGHRRSRSSTGAALVSRAAPTWAQAIAVEHGRSIGVACGAHVARRSRSRYRGAHVGIGERGRGTAAPTWHSGSRASTAASTWAHAIVEYRGVHVGTRVNGCPDPSKFHGGADGDARRVPGIGSRWLPVPAAGDQRSDELALCSSVP